MPFEIAPQVEAPAKVGRFQKFADAMLRGCAVTGPLRGALCDGEGNACALGAYLVGVGVLTPTTKAPDMDTIDRDWTPEERDAWTSYRARYGRQGIDGDNDNGDCSREQIAARIAAL